MKHTNRKFYESIDVNNVKDCNMRLKFDEMPNVLHLPKTRHCLRILSLRSSRACGTIRVFT